MGKKNEAYINCHSRPRLVTLDWHNGLSSGAISLESRLEASGPGSFRSSEWQIDDDHALMLHQPTGPLFSIYAVLSGSEPLS
jgi:hypothetical protein